MANKKETHIALINYFSDRKIFTKQDIYNYYQINGISLSDNALRWRIYDFKKAGLIKSIKRGVYTISPKQHFTHESSVLIRKITKLFLNRYNDINYCVWNTNCLNSLMIHQPISSFIVFETENDVTESVFYYFKDNNIKAFNNPSEKIMESYVLGEQDVVVVKPLVTRAPVFNEEQLVFPELEKILVDIFCDDHHFYIYGGHEMIIIFENAFNNYSINYSSLYGYAARRGKKDLLKKFIDNKVFNK